MPDVFAYQNFVVSTEGRPLAGASVLVKTQAGATATLYAPDGESTVDNPIMTDAVGYFLFYVVPGRYDVVISKAGQTPRTLEDVPIGTELQVSYEPTPNTIPLRGASAELFDPLLLGPYIDVRIYKTAENTWPQAIQAACDAIVAGGQKKTLLLPPATLAMGAGISVDVSFVSFHALGTKLDFSSLTTGAAVTLTGSINPPYGQSTVSLGGMHLLGNGKAGTVKGLYFNTEGGSGQGPSHITLRDMAIQSFGIGISLESRAYLINGYGFDVWDCGVCIDGPETTANGGTVVDGGEKITFFGSTFFNSDLAVSYRNGTGSLHFNNCSFDYNARQIEVLFGQVFATDCNIESGDYAAAPITVEGVNGVFYMKGGKLLSTQSPLGLTCDYVVETNVPDHSGGAWFDGVHINRMYTDSLYFGNSDDVHVLNSHSHQITENAPLLSPASNRLFDGGFEQATIVDNWFITDDTAPIADRFSGADIDLAIAATQFRTGAQSLKIAVTSGSTGCAVAVPVTPGSRPNFRLWYKKPGAHTGVFSFISAYANLRTGDNGVPVLLNRTDRGTDEVTFAADAVDWTATRSGEPMGRAPWWATHFIVYLYSSTFVGDLFIDDIEITEM